MGEEKEPNCFSADEETFNFDDFDEALSILEEKIEALGGAI